MFLHYGEIANAAPELFVLFFFIYLKIGSDVKKGQQSGNVCTCSRSGCFKGIFVLIGEGDLEMDF